MEPNKTPFTVCGFGSSMRQTSYRLCPLCPQKPQEAPKATFFWKDYNFKIIPIILGENFFFFQLGVLEVLPSFSQKFSFLFFQNDRITKFTSSYV